MIDWIPIKFAPEHGQKVLVVQNPETTATREPLFAIYNGNTKRYMPPEKFYEPTDKDGFTCKGWSDIIYWMPLPPIKYPTNSNRSYD